MRESLSLSLDEPSQNETFIGRTHCGDVDPRADEAALNILTRLVQIVEWSACHYLLRYTFHTKAKGETKVVALEVNSI
jgi:hypothetical protein